MIDLHYWTTPNGHKITMFLEETGLKYKIFPVQIGKGEQFRPEFLAIAPNNRIPAMLDHEPKGCLHDPVLDRWNPKRPFPAIRLGDHHSPNRLGTVSPLAQFPGQLQEPIFQLRCEAGRRHPVDAPRAIVSANDLPCSGKRVLRPDLVDQTEPSASFHTFIKCSQHPR